MLVLLISIRIVYVDVISNATTPTEYYKLVLGVDNTGVIWFVPISVYYISGTSAVGGIKYYNTSNGWSNPNNPTILPKLISCTGFDTGTATPDNNIIAIGQPALQYLPHRLELA